MNRLRSIFEILALVFISAGGTAFCAIMLFHAATTWHIVLSIRGNHDIIISLREHPFFFLLVALLYLFGVALFSLLFLAFFRGLFNEERRLEIFRNAETQRNYQLNVGNWFSVLIIISFIVMIGGVWLLQQFP